MSILHLAVRFIDFLELGIGWIAGKIGDALGLDSLSDNDDDL